MLVVPTDEKILTIETCHEHWLDTDFFLYTAKKTTLIFFLQINNGTCYICHSLKTYTVSVELNNFQFFSVWVLDDFKKGLQKWITVSPIIFEDFKLTVWNRFNDALRRISPPPTQLCTVLSSILYLLIFQFPMYVYPFVRNLHRLFSLFILKKTCAHSSAWAIKNKKFLAPP